MSSRTTRLCIAHASDLSDPSGGTDRVTAFASGIQQRGGEVVLVVPEPHGSFPERVSNIDIRTVPVTARGVADQPLRAGLVARHARRIAGERDLSLQFEHSTLAGVGSLLGSNDFVVDMHDLASDSPLYGNLPFGTMVQDLVGKIEGRGLRKASEVIVVSERMRDLVAEKWSLSAAEITVIPNGYFPSVVEPFNDVESVDGRVVFLGTLHPKVDEKVLIEIAKQDAVKELIVIGDGAKRNPLEEAKRKQDLTTLRVTGRLPDAQAFKFLASASVAVNPQLGSHLQRASSPVKLFTYAGFGIPMVLTSGPAPAEWLASEGAAKTVPPGGPFVDVVVSLLNSPEQQRNMALRASEAAEDARWDARVESLLELYV